MNILQCGIPKSGNFWLYKIIQQILKRSGQEHTSFIRRQPIYELAKTWELNFPEQAQIDVLDVTDLQYSYRISSIYKMPIDDIRAYTRQSPHVWSHSPVCGHTGELLECFDKKVYIIRDPRDMILSASRYYCSPYMLKYFPQEESDPQRFLEKNLDNLIHEWVWHVFDYLRLSQQYNIHIAFFEGFRLDFRDELDRLLSYLQLELTEKDKEAIEELVAFKNMKEKNPKHLKKGESGYWKDRLTDQQVERVHMMAGPLIRHLQYPMIKDQPMSYSSNPVPSCPEELKKDIIFSQQKLYQDQF